MTPCVFLVNARGNTYELQRWDKEIGKLWLVSEYGIELQVTKEEAEKNGYRPVKGSKQDDPKVPGHVHFFPVIQP